MHEYPKVLYRLDQIKIVGDGDEEAKARSEGFHDFNTPVEKEAQGEGKRSKKAGSVKSGNAPSS